MTGRNEDRVYITYLDIIYSKDNNVRIQACWVAKGKTSSFLIGKVLTFKTSILPYIQLSFHSLQVRYLRAKNNYFGTTKEAIARFPFLIGKVLTCCSTQRL